MQTTVYTTDGITVIKIAGRFDAYEAPDFNRMIQRAIGVPPARTVVNLRDVSFIDSTALGLLVQAMKRCRQHDGDLRLCELQKPVRIIFDLTRLDEAFAIYADEETAIRDTW